MRGSSRRQLQRRCAARIDELNLSAPLRPQAVKERLEAIRGREIWVLPDGGALPAEITGLWLGTSTRDYIYFRDRLSGCRLDHTLLHEFAHMICGHRSASVAHRQWLRAQAPGLIADDDIEHICMRSDFARAEEQEAELMASLILARAEPHRLAEHHGGEDAGAARVESIFLA